MNIIKSQDYFDPLNIKERCHIIGCGSVGSAVAELLARLGIENIHLYDFDVVEAHNIANQAFKESDIGRLKVEATKDLITSINGEISNSIVIHKEGYNNETNLSGYVFLCVDNIDLRREIAVKNKFNHSIVAMFDFRTRLEDAQHYAADWSNPYSVSNFIKSMEFSHDEAHEATPVTACNVEMGVAPTVRIITSFGVANFMNFVKTKNIKNIITANAFTFDVDAY